jgi:hypothetical protein
LTLISRLLVLQRLLELGDLLRLLLDHLHALLHLLLDLGGMPCCCCAAGSARFSRSAILSAIGQSCCSAQMSPISGTICGAACIISIIMSRRLDRGASCRTGRKER